MMRLGRGWGSNPFGGGRRGAGGKEQDIITQSRCHLARCQS